jgi:hypothetical protein
MIKEICKVKEDEVTIHTDIPGYSINGGTLPADIITTSQRPDIVLINRKDKRIALLELTVSFKKNIDSANLRKSSRDFDLYRGQTDYERYIWKGATYSLPNTKHALPTMELYVLLKGIC